MKYKNTISAVLTTISLLLLTVCCTNKSDNYKDQKQNSGTQNQENMEWASLFNGKNLDGWEILGNGNSEFYVENNAIVGKAKMGGMQFLGTKKHYTNFILTLDFKISQTLNSGVQIRSRRYKQDTTTHYTDGSLEDKDKHWEKGSVHGYQIEIDPSERAWTGGLFEEGGRGWMQPLKDNKKAQKAFKPNQWNSFKIIAQGNHLKSWINGVQAIDVTDSMNVKKGFIALQIDGIKEKKQVGEKELFKNIRIKEIK